MVGLTDEMLSDRDLTKEITRLTKLNPTDKMDFISNIVNYMNDKNSIIYTKMVDGEKKEIKLKSAFETKQIYGHLHHGIPNPLDPTMNYCSCIQFHNGYPICLNDIIEQLR